MNRLDKLLAKELNITRSEAKSLIKQGAVTVNGAPAKSGEIKCGGGDEITVGGKRIAEKEFVYIMMNKPKGVLSASDGKGEKTVIDLLPQEMKRKNLFPAGRLDKDTTGFMLITDDGTFAHDILSPKKHIDKTYAALLDKPIDDDVKRDFENGMTLNGETLLPAELKAVNSGKKEVTVILRQGVYHQIKRMFKKHGITVLELKRTAMGGLPLDSSLAEGESRYLTEDELNLITSSHKAQHIV